MWGDFSSSLLPDFTSCPTTCVAAAAISESVANRSDPGFGHFSLPCILNQLFCLLFLIRTLFGLCMQALVRKEIAMLPLHRSLPFSPFFHFLPLSLLLSLVSPLLEKCVHLIRLRREQTVLQNMSRKMSVSNIIRIPCAISILSVEEKRREHMLSAKQREEGGKREQLLCQPYYVWT